MSRSRGAGREQEQLAFDDFLAPCVFVEPAVRPPSQGPEQTYQECLANAKQVYAGVAREGLLVAQLRLREMRRAHGPRNMIIAMLEVVEGLLEELDR